MELWNYGVSDKLVVDVLDDMYPFFLIRAEVKSLISYFSYSVVTSL